MAKTCVFCGEKPHEKSKEHIIPKWLIEFTGDLKRVIQLGEKNIAFDQMTFPACDKCNNEFSDLEGKCKVALLKIFDEKEILEEDLNNLLDWFDKVRIGIWLLSLRMVNFFPEFTEDFEPKFHIKTRVRKADRLLKIKKLNNSRKGINVIGTITPHFLTTPSCFGLIINNYLFTNISYSLLFNDKLGFPKIKKILFDENLNMSVSLSNSAGKIKRPIVLDILENSCTTIFQPIVPAPAVKFMDKSRKEKLLYKPYTEGIGRFFIFDGNYSFFKKRILKLETYESSWSEREDMLIFYNEISMIQEHLQKKIMTIPKFSKDVPHSVRAILKENMHITTVTHSMLYKKAFDESLNSSVNDLVEYTKQIDSKSDPIRMHSKIKSLMEYKVRKGRGEKIYLDLKPKA